MFEKARTVGVLNGIKNPPLFKYILKMNVV
jgi:hypothetical protein